MESEIVYTSPKYIGLVIIALLVIALTCFLALRQFMIGPEVSSVSRSVQQRTYTTIAPFWN